MQDYQTAGPQNDKIQPGQESKMAMVTKNRETIKSFFFLQNHLVYLAEILYDTSLGSWDLVFQNYQSEKKSLAELGHRDLLSVY